MSNQNEALKELIETHSDVFIKALAEDNELLKALTNAVNLAKQEQKILTLKKLKEEAALGGTEDLSKIDPKLVQKAIKLVCGPVNEENVKAFNALFDQGLSANAKSGEGVSLLTIALDYLTTKERVEMDWPWMLTQRGAQCHRDEVKKIVELFNQRSSNLGSNSKPFLLKMFSQPRHWGDLEKDCVAAKLLEKNEQSLLHFLESKVSDYNSAWGAEHWRCVEVMVKMGVVNPKEKKIGHSSNEPFWQALLQKTIAENAEKGNGALEKVEAFKQIKEAGWLSDWGVVRIEDSLDPSVLPDAQRSAQRSGMYRASPTRVHLSTGSLDDSYVPILKILQEYEQQAGVETQYDGLGCSRLYFVNNRVKGSYNIDEKSLQILMDAAQECLSLGDSPLSVNAQNPIAKSASHLRGIIQSALEQQEIHSVLFAAKKGNNAEDVLRAEEVKKPSRRL